MASMVYTIARTSEGLWCIRFGRRSYGPFPRKSDAIELALGAAQQIKESGCDVQVVEEVTSTRTKPIPIRPRQGADLNAE